MIKYKIIFLVITLLIVSCKSSYTEIGDKKANYIPYYLKVYEVDSLFYSGNYADYKNELESLFSKYEPLNITSFNEYENYTKSLISLNKAKKHKRELKTLISNFGYKYEDLLKDSILSIALKNSKMSTNYLNKLEEKYKKGLDAEFIKTLKKIEFDDEEIRTRQGLTLEERKPLMIEVDKKNDSIIKNYILNNGFPRKEKVDNFSFDLLFNHFSYNGSYDFYKKNLPQNIKNGTCNPNDYAALIDRWYRINKGEPFYYMTWISKLNEIENDSEKFKQINSERKKIGLPSIKQKKALLQRQLNMEQRY